MIRVDLEVEEEKSRDGGVVEEKWREDGVAEYTLRGYFFSQ